MSGAYRSAPQRKTKTHVTTEIEQPKQHDQEKGQQEHLHEEVANEEIEGKEAEQEYLQRRDIRNSDDLSYLATKIAFDIIKSIAQGQRDDLARKLSRTVPFNHADIEEGVRRFISEYDLAQQRDNQILCATAVENVEAIPVDSKAVAATPAARFMDADDPTIGTDRPWLDLGLLRDVLDRTGLKTEALERSDAGDAFHENLTSFIFTRLLGSLFPSGGSGPLDSPMPPETGVLTFTVHSNLQGLRVHYDPIYLHSGSGRVFGSPTSPVKGWLEPGVYIFGGATYGAPRWDPDGVYEVPLATEAHLNIPDAQTL